jgi:hypothetical protein
MLLISIQHSTNKHQCSLTFLVSFLTSSSSFIILSRERRVFSAFSSKFSRPVSSTNSCLDSVSSSLNFFTLSRVLLVKLSSSFVNCCLALATYSNLLLRPHPLSTSSDLSCRCLRHICQPYSDGFCYKSCWEVLPQKQKYLCYSIGSNTFSVSLMIRSLMIFWRGCSPVTNLSIGTHLPQNRHSRVGLSVCCCNCQPIIDRICGTLTSLPSSNLSFIFEKS